MKTRVNTLLDQSSAIGSYLDELLYDATAGLCAPGISLKDQDSGKSFAEKTKAVPDDTAQTLVTPVEEQESEPQYFGLKPEMFPLNCLMFRVADYALAMPLVQMRGVFPWNDKLTRLPHSPDWLLGLTRHRNRKLSVIDSTKILGLSPLLTVLPKYILVLDDDEWAMTCTELGAVVKLKYEDIQWRKNISSQIALGTIRNSLACLLSPLGIVDALKRARVRSDGRSFQIEI